jgi:hypothetical protein
VNRQQRKDGTRWVGWILVGGRETAVGRPVWAMEWVWVLHGEAVAATRR